ncbi:MAG: DUF4230 domain-containing protein, partial [Burkholderiales bacterium]
MDADLMTDELPNARRNINVAKASSLPWLLFILVLAIAAWLAYEAFGPQEKGSPLGTTLTAFEKQNKLTVFSAQLAPVVASEDSRLLGLVNSKQVAIIPARVDYTLDLSQMDRSRLDWNEQTQLLTVRLPALIAGKRTVRSWVCSFQSSRE